MFVKRKLELKIFLNQIVLLKIMSSERDKTLGNLSNYARHIVEAVSEKQGSYDRWGLIRGLMSKRMLLSDAAEAALMEAERSGLIEERTPPHFLKVKATNIKRYYLKG